MNWKTIGRILVCLLLVCCLIVNISPIKAEASVAAAAVTAAAYVAANAEIIAGSILISLGVMQGLASDDFQQTVTDCVAHLDSLGTWVQDGTMQLLRTVDEAGTATYYAAMDMMEAVRAWTFDSGVVSASAVGTSLAYSYSVSFDGSSYNLYATDYDGNSIPFCVGVFRDSWPSSSTKRTYYLVCYSSYEGYVYGGQSGVQTMTSTSLPYRCNVASTSSSYAMNSFTAASVPIYEYWTSEAMPDIVDDYTTSRDLTLGVMHTGAIDGETYDDAYADYYRKQLQVYETGGSGDSGDDGNDPNWKKYLPLGLAVTMAGTMALDQVTEWEANTPAEFADQTTTSQEFEILSQPEVDIGTAIEIQPATGDDAGGDSSGETDPTEVPGSSPTEAPSSDPDATEVPNPDDGTDTGGDSSGDSVEDPSWLQKMLDGIQILLKSLADTLLNGIKDIFVPSEDFLTDKVKSLRDRFDFADSIITSGEAIGDSLYSLGSEPPVIYIHLGDAEGSYDYGGTVAFLDMTWYERYKPVGDQLLSSLMWLFFAWRCFVHAPSIISGLAGDVEAFNIPGMGGAFLPGNEFRDSGYEKPYRGRFESRKRTRR